MEQIVRVSDSYPYILDDQGEVDWSPRWTFPNALLFTMTTLTLIGTVENILKASLDSIPSPSPSVKIQIMGGKFCLRCKGKTLLGIVNKLFQKFVDNTQQCFALALHLKQNFPPII